MNQRGHMPLSEPPQTSFGSSGFDPAELQARELGALPAHPAARAWRPVAPTPFTGPRPSVASSGESLAAPVRADAERRLGFDLSSVRIHRDPVAERFAEEQDANAVTIGRDVYFGRGMFAPETNDGQRLVTHELAHTVQQTTTGIFALQRDEKKGGKKGGAKQKRRKPNPVANLTDAEKAQIRQKVDELIGTVSEKYINDVDGRPSLAKLDTGKRTKISQLRSKLESARKGAANVTDSTDRATRLALLDAAIAAMADKYFVYGVLDELIGISSMGIGTLGNPGYQAKPEDLEHWKRETAILRGGGKSAIRANVTTAMWDKMEQKYGVTAEMVKTDDQTAAEQKASGGKGITVEDRRRLQELYSAIPADEKGGDIIDPQLLAEKLRDMDAKELEQLKEFVRQRPKTPDEEVPSFEEMLEQFKKLSPAERDTLLVNQELNAQSPRPAKLDGKILLELTKGDAPMTQAASDIDSNMKLIGALVADPAKMKGRKPLSVDIGLFEMEMALFRGLLGGGAARSEMVRGAVTDLTAALAQAQRELQKELLVEVGITAGLALLPVVGAAKLAATLARLELLRRKIDKLRKAYAIVDQVRAFLDFIAGIPAAIEELSAFMAQAQKVYTTAIPKLQELAETPNLDEEIAKLEDGMIDKFDELLEGKMGEILEMFYLAPDTPEEELVRIIYDLPKGVTALQNAWEFYSGTSSEEPQAAERLLIRSAKAGALLYPVVGFLAAFAAERIGAAFPDVNMFDRVAGKLVGHHKDKKKRRASNRGSFFRLNRRNYDYNEAELNPHLAKGEDELRKLIKDDEPGQHWIAGWLRVSIRDKLDDLNRKFAAEKVTAKVKERVPATRKKKATRAVSSRQEKVPLPPFRVKFSRLDRDPKNETVELSLNPKRTLKFDTLTYDDFKKPEGVPFSVSGRAKRDKAVRSWLEDRDYRVVPDNNKNPHVRLEGGRTPGRNGVYLHIDAKSTPKVLRAGINTNDHKNFLDRSVSDSNDLPEGFYLKSDRSGALISRKSGVRKDQEAPALGLDEKGKLTVGGRSKLGPETTAPLGVTKPGDSDLESYDWQKSLRTTLSGGDYDAQDGKVSTWDRRAASTKWGDMKKRPKRVSGEVGYILRARAFGDSLGSIFPPELKKGDDKGHLVAKRFGGGDHLNNIIPMKRSVNQFPGKWYDVESDMAKVYTGKTATPGHRLWLSIEIDYAHAQTRRPNRFRIEWKELSRVNGSALSGKGSGRRLSISND
jgi:hypothetical protein